MTGKTAPRILLVYPSCYHYPVWMERLDLKTSLVWLASYLHRSFPVTYADFEIGIGRPNSAIQIKRYARQVRRYLESQSFDILALSCWTSLSYQATVTTARLCRELYPDCLIVVGGYHPSARPQEFITEEHLFDYVVRGEGELSLEAIARDYPSTGRPKETIVIDGPTVTKGQFVNYDWDLMADFVTGNFGGKLSNVYLFLSRGCPFACSFCMEPSKDRSWRAFSPQQSLDIIQEVVGRFDPYAIAISDACFGMRPSWRKEFLSKLLDMRPEFWIVFETRPEYLDEEDAQILAQLKVEVQFGLESCSPDMLRVMQKTRNPDHFLRKFRTISGLLTEHKVLHRANLIFNHPGETRQSLAETFAFMDRQLEQNDSYLIWACHGFMHFPGCGVDCDRDQYEEHHGTRFVCGDWWREDGDQYENSQRVIPSRDLDGDHAGLWKVMHDERLDRMKASLSDTAFKFAARKYFLEWQTDARFARA